ncbi:hypothetical protein [Blautia sp.]
MLQEGHDRHRNDFTNIILVFDYERHDPAFSEEKILEMQVFQEVASHNICKAARIQKVDANENDLRKQFEQIDLSEILNVQNEAGRNLERGFIWVLSTCVLLIPDYNFNLIN